MNDLLSELSPAVLQAELPLPDPHAAPARSDHRLHQLGDAFEYQEHLQIERGLVVGARRLPRPEDFAELKADVEKLVCTGYTPQLIRHVQISTNAMLSAGPRST